MSIAAKLQVHKFHLRCWFAKEALTEPTHVTLMITSTDGACDLLRTYGEQSVFVRKA